MVDAAGTTGYTYDSAGRLSTVTDVHGKTITYSYNDCGLRSGWTDQFSGTVSFSYSNMHALTSLTDRNSEATSYQYDTGGRLSKITLANSAYTDYAYNNRNLVTSVTNKKSDATVISSYTYQYDSAGNPTKMTEANGDYTDYGYDNVYELTSEVMKDSGGSTIYSIAWTYDNVGNRATQTKDGNQTSYTYNNMNQMTVAGSATLTYDSNGNTASKTESQATTNYTWNYENALSKIDNSSGDDYVYEYEGDGMRVRSGHDSGQGSVWDSRFYYDVGTSPYAYLFESDNDKTMTVAYTTDPRGNLISQRRGGATYYHLYDRLGSTRQFLNSNQATTDSYSYYAFGDVRASSGSTANPFKFVGRLGYYDDPSTDCQYLRARYYGPSQGRFLNLDPVALHLAELRVPPTFILLVAKARAERQYGYADNLPTVKVDPSGHDWGSYMGCMNDKLTQAGIAVPLFILNIVALGCGVAGTVVAICCAPAGPAAPPAGVVAAVACMAFVLGVDIGVLLDAAWECRDQLCDGASGHAH
jgi:RHS repeat-associated protein